MSPNITNIPDKTSKKDDIIDVLTHLPFPFCAIRDLPYDDQEKKVAFFSLLSAASASLPNLFFDFRGNKYFTHFYQLIYGKSASGKGRLSIANKALYKIRKQIAENYEIDLLSWKKEELEAKINKVSIDEIQDLEARKPKKEYLYTPDQTTTATLIEDLENAKNGAFLFSTEGSTFFKSMKGGYGDSLSPHLCRIFHHEPLAAGTRKDSWRAYLEEPKLAMLASCTESQLEAFFSGDSDLLQGGLSYRFSFFETTQKAQNAYSLHDQDLENKREQIENNISSIFFQKWEMLRQNETRCRVLIDDDIRAQADQFFSARIKEYVKYNEDFHSFIFRTQINYYRILSIFTAFRSMDNLREATHIRANKQDACASLIICETWLRESLKLHLSWFEKMGKKTRKITIGEIYNILFSLERPFSYTEFVQACMNKAKTSKNTAKNWLSKGLEKGWVAKNEDGLYFKLETETDNENE